MSSPYPLIVTIVIYLWIVLKIGPQFMLHRKPYNLTTIIRVYNILQVIACSYFVVTAHQHGFSFKLTWKCIDVPAQNEVIDDDLLELNKMLWHFMFLRLFEFVETIFFVLRKKFDQISSLHVYHHLSTAVNAIKFIQFIF